VAHKNLLKVKNNLLVYPKPATSSCGNSFLLPSSNNHILGWPKHFLIVNFFWATLKAPPRRIPKGQLISKCPFGVIVWTKKPNEKI